MSWPSAVHSGNSCRLTNPRWEKPHRCFQKRWQWLVFFLLAWFKAFFFKSQRVPPFFLGDFRQNQQTEFQLGGVLCFRFSYLTGSPVCMGVTSRRRTQDELQPGERRAITARMLFVGPIFCFKRSEKI